MDTETTGVRLPPQNIEAERSVLGAMMLDPQAVPKVLQYLEAEHFYRQAHRMIFSAMLELERNQEPIDQLTVTDVLKKRGQLEQVGGAYYITELVEAIPSTANVEYYALLVLDAATLRELIHLTGELATKAYETRERVEDLVGEAERRIFELSARRMKKQGFITLREVLSETFEKVDAYHKSGGLLRGVPTGFEKLDDLTGGLQPSEFIVLAGRPSMGKTALALNIARNAAVDHKIGVGFFSLEMSRFELGLRLLCAEARVDHSLVRSGKLPTALYQRLSKAAGVLAEAPIFLDESPALSILELRSKARRLKAEQNVGLIVVDYLQLIEGPKNAENKQQEVAAISRSLKQLARELDTPVVALSQLSRAIEQRGGRGKEYRPMLSDLRDSGSIEQDADVVLFIHRPEFYGILEDKNGNSLRNVAEVIIGKQRNGPQGIEIRLTFIKSFTRFDNMPDYIPPEAEEAAQPVPF